MAIPITLKEGGGIILTVQLKKFGKLRISSVHIPPRGEMVVSKIKAPAALGRGLRQLAVQLTGFANCGFAPRIVGCKNHASAAFFCPGQERVAVLLDKANGPVNQRRLAFEQRSP